MSSGGSSGSGFRRGPGSSGTMVSDFDESFVEGLVAQVINTFEGTSLLTLTPAARNIVLLPAIQHSAHILEELGSGVVVPEQIKNAVQTLLTNAASIAQEKSETEIDEQIIKIAMRLECRYFPWC